MKLFFTILVVLASTIVSAQKISGTVKDDQGKALSGTSITLQRVKDSSIVKIAASNSSGQYSFINIQPGTYFVGASHVSHAKRTSASFDVSGSGDVTVPELILEKLGIRIQN